MVRRRVKIAGFSNFKRQWQTSNQLVAGSNPAGRVIYHEVVCGPLAQLEEHGTLNPGVTGSIPVRPTICIDLGREWWNGRHAGLRIPWLRPCGFKSHLSHH